MDVVLLGNTYKQLTQKLMNLKAKDNHNALVLNAKQYSKVLTFNTLIQIV